MKPSSKEEILRLIRKGRQEIAELVGGLSESELTRIPGPQTTRSVKDLLAHIVWWEEFLMFRVNLVCAGEPIERVEHLDAINERVYQSLASLTVEQVMASFGASLDRLEAFFGSLTWEEIDGGIDYLGGSLHDVVASNTYEHYQQHAGQLKSFVDSL